ARLVALGAATARRPRRVRGPLRRRRRLARPRCPGGRTRAALTGLRRARLAPQETPRPVLRPGPAPRPPGRHPLPHGRGTDRAGGRPRRPTRLRGAMDTEYTDAVARYLRDREAAEAEARAARGSYEAETAALDAAVEAARERERRAEAAAEEAAALATETDTAVAVLWRGLGGFVGEAH